MENGGAEADAETSATRETNARQEKESGTASFPEAAEKNDTDLKEAPKNPELLKNAPTLIAGNNPNEQMWLFLYTL